MFTKKCIKNLDGGRGASVPGASLGFDKAHYQKGAENSHKDGEVFARNTYILNLSHRAENVQETQPVNLMNEWNAVWNAVMSVHKLLGNLYRECEDQPQVLPSVNKHLLCMREKSQQVVASCHCFLNLLKL